MVEGMIGEVQKKKCCFQRGRSVKEEEEESSRPLQKSTY
jgi:hypothetical protein